MLEYIKQNYPIKTAKELADVLNTCEANIRFYIKKLGLKKQVKYDYDMVETLLETMRPIDVAKVTSINVNTIHTIKFRLKKRKYEQF